jgi:hypothetical protein
MKPHKHAELIKAWADGAEIEQKTPHGVWENFDNEWTETWYEYRIKPEPKPDVVLYTYVAKPQPHIEGLYAFVSNAFSCDVYVNAKLKLIFDGETGELKSAEVLK